MCILYTKRFEGQSIEFYKRVMSRSLYVRCVWIAVFMHSQSHFRLTVYFYVIHSIDLPKYNLLKQILLCLFATHYATTSHIHHTQLSKET